MRQQDQAEEVLDELLQCESGMTGWELDFIESMDKQRGREWSEIQINKLHTIYERVC